MSNCRIDSLLRKNDHFEFFGFLRVVGGVCGGPPGNPPAPNEFFRRLDAQKESTPSLRHSSAPTLIDDMSLSLYRSCCSCGLSWLFFKLVTSSVAGRATCSGPGWHDPPVYASAFHRGARSGRVCTTDPRSVGRVEVCGLLACGLPFPNRCPGASRVQ